MATLTACGHVGKDISQRRSEIAAMNGRDIVIGAAGDELGDTAMPWRGLMMAMDEINAAGGVLGSSVRLRREDDGNHPTRALDIAQKFADDPEVMGVIGHNTSDVTVPASTVYDFSRLVMLSPAATSPALTDQGYTFIFRNVPSDLENGRQVAEFAREQGYRRIGLYYIKDIYGRGLANSFANRARDLELDVVTRIGYPSGSSSTFAEDIRKFSQEDLDAVYLVARLPEGAEFIRRTRAAGLEIPIIGCDALDRPDLLQLLGDAGDGLIMPEFVDIDARNPRLLKFIQDFRSRYSVEPDEWAVLYYDALKILAEAMARAGTPDPVKVAEALRDRDALETVSGTTGFDLRGDQTGIRITFEIVEDGKFRQFERP